MKENCVDLRTKRAIEARFGSLDSEPQFHTNGPAIIIKSPVADSALV